MGGLHKYKRLFKQFSTQIHFSYMKFVLNQCGINNTTLYKVTQCDFNACKAKTASEMKGTFSFSKYSIICNEKNIYPLQCFFYKEEFEYEKC